MDLANDYKLEQLVGKPTRKEALLDLVFSSAPESLSECTATILQPTSDHNLISFELEVPTTNDNQCAYSPNTSEICKFNFKRANTSAMKQALTNTNWGLIIGNADNIEHANQNFTNAIIAAANTAKVPHYRKAGNPNNQQLQKLMSDRNKLNTKLNKEDLRATDKLILEKQVEKKTRTLPQLFIGTRKIRRRRPLKT